MRTETAKGNALAALFNGTCVLLLSLFYNNAAKSYYLREVVRKLGIGSGTVQREISKLVSAGLLNRRVEGRQVYYGANTKSSVYDEIRGLIIKSFGMADVIRDVLEPLSGRIDYAFIYGSQADGTAAAGSDIDLMVVGKIGEMELHKAISRAEGKLDKVVNYSLLTPAEFRRRRKEKKGFVGRISGGKKIMLIGDENEI